MSDITLRHISKTYGPSQGLFDLSLTVEKGSAFGLLGPTGSGKTTAVRILSGLVYPDEGKAAIGGMDCARQRHLLMRGVGVAQSDARLPKKTSGEAFIRLLSSVRGNVPSARMRELLEKLDLNPLGDWAHMMPDQRRKVVLVLAFLHSPDVLILDEPCLGLSPHDRSAVLSLIREERERGTTIFMTSHVLEEVQRCCDTIGILREGRAVSVQTAQALTQTRQKVYHITFEDMAQAAAFAQEWGSGVELLRNRASVAIPSSPQVLLKTLAKYTVVDLVGGREAPEDSILQTFGGDVL